MNGIPWRRRIFGNADMASCMEVSRLLHTYLDGRVDEVTARRIRRHLEACRRCGLEAETYAKIKDALARRTPTVDEGAVERLRRFAAELPTSEQRRQGRDSTGDT